MQPLHPAMLVVGSDYSYGQNAAGNVLTLKKSFPVSVVSLLEEDGKKISTQSIIKAIQNGHISEANAELGRAYEVQGLIAHGLEKLRGLLQGFGVIRKLLHI